MEKESKVELGFAEGVSDAVAPARFPGLLEAVDDSLLFDQQAEDHQRQRGEHHDCGNGDEGDEDDPVVGTALETVRTHDQHHEKQREDQHDQDDFAPVLLHLAPHFFPSLQGAPTAVAQEDPLLAEVAVEVEAASFVAELAGVLSPLLQASFVDVPVVALASADGRSAGDYVFLEANAAVQALGDRVALEGFRALEDHRLQAESRRENYYG